jgi:hypothetical protein
MYIPRIVMTFKHFTTDFFNYFLARDMFLLNQDCFQSLIELRIDHLIRGPTSFLHSAS